MRYDLLVVGSGPSGQKGAIAAAKLDRRVAIVERRSTSMGGVCLHSGTIPSKTMREAILHLTGYRQKDVYSESFRKKRSITMKQLRRKLDRVTEHELDVVQDQLARNGVDVFVGEASFVDPNQVRVSRDGHDKVVSADRILLACGSRPARPAHVPFDGQTVFDSDDFLVLDRIPRSMIVVGAGVIGIEYAIMLAILGVNVTLVDGRERLLDFCDREIIDTLLYHARGLGIVLRLGENVVEIEKRCDGVAAVELESGKSLIAETVMFSVGRVGDTANLALPAAGIEVDSRGRIQCDERFQTSAPNIYAVGDVIGFPALASVSMEQGRQAACHALGHPVEGRRQMPYGLFTIPEVSMFGKNEQELTAECVPYEIGVARFDEIARGQILGDHSGMLKLLFHRESRKLLGIHCIGETATEIVHIGQAVMELGGTLEYLRDAVFNYPTMAECYKVAAFDGLNRLRLGRSGTAAPIEIPANTEAVTVPV